MLGSYQGDALQNITGDISPSVTTGRAGFPMASTTPNGALRYGQGSGQIFIPASGNSMNLYSLTFDASLVARTATETRASNTAFAPRIIAF